MKRETQTDDKAREEAAEAARLEHEQLLADVAALFSTPAGERFFNWFFQRGMLFSTTFTGNSTGYFLEGTRNLALTVFNVVLQAAPVEKLVALVQQIKGDTTDGTTRPEARTG